MKIELKHLAPYLPYGLQVKDKMNPRADITYQVLSISIENVDRVVINYHSNNFMFIHEVQPILRPLSDLIVEIEHNGEKFIPMLELLKIHQTDQEYQLTSKYDVIKLEYSDNILFKELSNCYKAVFMWGSNFGPVIEELMYDTQFNRFTLRQPSATNPQKWLQYDILEEKLFEWGFDKFKLIDNGLAIDINTLTPNTLT